MVASSNRGLAIATVIVVGLVVFFGGGAITGRRMGEHMGLPGGYDAVRAWMWIPAVLALGFVGLLLVSMFGKKE